MFGSEKERYIIRLISRESRGRKKVLGVKSSSRISIDLVESLDCQELFMTEDETFRNTTIVPVNGFRGWNPDRRVGVDSERQYRLRIQR